MSDGSDGHPPDNPAAAVRRAMRPALRRRFYDKVGTVPEAGGYAVRLDGKPVRTPAGRGLAAPSAALAQALAAEWDAQRDLIDPARMPLTRLANSIIDGVGDRPDPVAAEIEKYLASDLVCYRAAAPSVCFIFPAALPLCFPASLPASYGSTTVARCLFMFPPPPQPWQRSCYWPQRRPQSRRAMKHPAWMTVPRDE